MQVCDVYNSIDEFAPFDSQLSFDNAGFLVGNRNADVTGILISLDITNDVVIEANKLGFNLIVSHHPVIFHPFKQLEINTPAYLLAKYDISAICAHTNLDAAEGGVNDALCDVLGIKNQTHIGDVSRIGDVDETDIGSFSKKVKRLLKAPSVVYTEGIKSVRRVAVCGGSGGDEIFSGFAAGADTFVTGEVRHHEFLEVKRLGLNVVCAGHFATENVVLKPLQSYLEERYPDTDIRIAECNSDPVKAV